MSAPATTLGRYQVIREIARSNDIVYEGYDPAMNRRVALKELVYPTSGTDAQKEDRLKRFLREAKAAGSLTHPNIVTIYEVGEDQGRSFIAMEYLEGRSLRERLDSDGSVPLEESVRILSEVLDALQYAHQHGVIHRDVKPDNIHLLSDGRVKLTDFGIARLTFEQSITLDGQVFGTPSYMSPEQVVGRDLDARTDIFSAGVVLYEMLTGAKPFTGDSVVTVTYNICNVDPQSPPGVPYAVEAVIRRALEKSVSLRYGSASEMRSALKDATTQPQPDPTAMYGPSPYIPQGAIPGIAPQQPTAYGGPPAAVPPPYTGPLPQTPQTTYPSGYTPPPPTVWLPPPPRPLLSPKAKQMLGQTLVTFLVGAAIIAICVAAIIGIAKWYTVHQANQRDAIYSQQIAEAKKLAATDPAKAVDVLTNLEQTLQSDEYKTKVRQSRAWAYEQVGRQQKQYGRYSDAESAFLSAVEDDPRSPAPHTDLGDLYEGAADAQQSETDRRDFWAKAADEWKAAADLATNGGDTKSATGYANHAAYLQLRIGQSLERDGMMTAAYKFYGQAYEAATPGSEQQKQAAQAQEQLDRKFGR